MRYSVEGEDLSEGRFFKEEAFELDISLILQVKEYGKVKKYKGK